MRQWTFLTKALYQQRLMFAVAMPLIVIMRVVVHIVGISTASSILTFMYQWPRALHFCTAAMHIYFVPCLRTHPRPNRVISPNDDILLLLIGCTLNANLSPYQMYASDSLSTGILRVTHLDYLRVHHQILFSDAGDMLTSLIQSSLPLPLSHWCIVSTLSSGICIWYNIVASLVSINENPREQFFVCSCWYFNIVLKKRFASCARRRTSALQLTLSFVRALRHRTRTWQYESAVMWILPTTSTNRPISGSLPDFSCFLSSNKSLIPLPSQQTEASKWIGHWTDFYWWFSAWSQPSTRFQSLNVSALLRIGHRTGSYVQSTTSAPAESPTRRHAA